jgi:hypothetical protein
VLFAGGWYYVRSLAQRPVAPESGIPVTDVGYNMSPEHAAILNANRSGSYEQAAAQYNAIAGNPLSTSDSRATAITAGLGVRYRNSGDVTDFIKDIKDLKAAITDPGVSARNRVIALDMLGSSYCRSGRSDAVFQEIYSGEPFSKYLAPGDPNLSSRHLYEWSYEIYPTTKAAVRLERWYVEELLWNDSLPAATQKEYLDRALKYGADADQFNQRDLQRFGTDHLQSSAYAAYWYWRAVNQGGLAQLGVGDYKDTYRKAYDDFFNVIANQQNEANKQYLPYAYLFLADTIVKVGGSTEEADQWLKKAIDFTVADTGVNDFGVFIKNEASKPAWDYSSKSVYDMMDISPEFKSFVSSLVQA